MAPLDFSGFYPYHYRMATAKTNRGGRPRKAADQVRGGRLDLRLQPAEKAAFQQAAELSGLDMSAWIRDRLRRLAQQELEAAGRPVAFLSVPPLSSR